MNKNINKQNHDHILMFNTDNYKKIPQNKLASSRYNYETAYTRRHLERYLFNKDVNNIVEKYKKKYKDKYPFSEENNLDVEGKNSNVSSECNVYTSDLETNYSDMTYIRRVKSMKNIKEENGKLHKIISTNLIPVIINTKDKQCFDKTTYCQPAVRYNQEFIFKMIEKNNKLKKIVNELLLSRQQEKQDVKWNNYINELKNKHRSFANYSRPTVFVPDNENQIDSKIIEDITNTKFSWEPSLHCSNLSKDLFEANSVLQQSQYIQGHAKQVTTSKNSIYVPFENNFISYPTCSHGRLILLEREKQRLENEMKRRKHYNKNLNSISNIKKISTSIQTEFLISQANIGNNLMSKSVNVNNDVRDITEKTEFYKNYNSLINLGDKLETLIESINNFIHKVKNRNVVENKCVSVSCKIDLKNKKINTKKSASTGPIRTEHTAHTLAIERSLDTLSNIIPKLNHVKSKDIFNKMSGQSMNKTPGEGKYLEDFGTLINKPKCSAQIQFQIPTRDCYTEVTKSLPHQSANGKNKTKEVIIPSVESNQQINIAINTDPLSVFTLLRISTEAFLNLLSFVPNINYSGYLSMLQFPKVLKREENSNVCKICGAAFRKPSELSDHIQGHNLRKTRDCCVCRHMLDKPRWPAYFFTCQYCGQKFTRAYCCELHEQTCATQLGKHHDVSPSLSTLR